MLIGGFFFAICLRMVDAAQQLLFVCKLMYYEIVLKDACQHGFEQIEHVVSSTGRANFFVVCAVRPHVFTAIAVKFCLMLF